MIQEKLTESFPITSVNREDLEEILTREQIERLDDDDMHWIARKMSDIYCETRFWIDLEFWAECVLEKKDKQ